MSLHSSRRQTDRNRPRRQAPRLVEPPPPANPGPPPLPLSRNADGATPCPGGSSRQGSAHDADGGPSRSSGTSSLLSSTNEQRDPWRTGDRTGRAYMVRTAVLPHRTAHTRNNQMKPAPIGPPRGPTARENLRLEATRETTSTDRSRVSTRSRLSRSPRCAPTQCLGLRTLSGPDTEPTGLSPTSRLS